MILSDLVLSSYADLAAYWWLPLAAVLLDRAVGDPPGLPHPVRAIGALLPRVETRARRAASAPFEAGLVAALAVLAVTYGAVRLPLVLPLLGTLVALYLAFAGLALGQLLREGKAALALLERGDLPGARHAVGYLVSRDVSRADSEELCRVLAETLAENMSDAFTAPLFWLLLGGPVTLWLYKAASTMDSTWGYPHEPWTKFGTAAARLDDALAFIPARLTAVFLFLTARLTGTAIFWPGFARVRQDAATMKSPNAGWPMAACAWLHNAAMGGRAVYAGKVTHKPILGPAGQTWTPEKLRALISQLDLAGYLTAAVLLACGYLVTRW